MLRGLLKCVHTLKLGLPFPFYTTYRPQSSRLLPGTFIYLFTGCFTQTLTLFHYDQVQDTQVCINNAATDRLALSLASSPGAIAGMALAEQKADTSVSQDTLLHGEALLVIATAYPHNIAL